MFSRDEKTSGYPWLRRVGTVSRCGRAWSHPPPETVTHTTEPRRLTDAALIVHQWRHSSLRCRYAATLNIIFSSFDTFAKMYLSLDQMDEKNCYFIILLT